MEDSAWFGVRVNARSNYLALCSVSSGRTVGATRCFQEERRSRIVVALNTQQHQEGVRLRASHRPPASSHVHTGERGRTSQTAGESLQVHTHPVNPSVARPALTPARSQPPMHKEQQVRQEVDLLLPQTPGLARPPVQMPAKGWRSRGKP